jgi:hypothetical protein
VQLTVQQRRVSLFGATYAIRPLAAELALETLLPPSAGGAGDLAIIVTPLSVDLRIWAFASTTSNSSGQVSLWLPR